VSTGEAICTNEVSRVVPATAGAISWDCGDLSMWGSGDGAGNISGGGNDSREGVRGCMGVGGEELGGGSSIILRGYGGFMGLCLMCLGLVCLRELLMLSTESRGGKEHSEAN
jgi:hypothetical protein